MTEPRPTPTRPAAALFPRVPGYAWSWLQRSRPVLAEVSQRLDGGPPPPGFVDTLRERFEVDAFVRDVVVGVVADVAFKGRIPRRRPPGASWDRGLIWWAAAIAGTTPQEFDTATTQAVQSPLFAADDLPATAERVAQRRRRRGGERAALAAALRQLLTTARDDRIPAAAVRQLLTQLEEPHSAEGPQPQ